jgi:cytochrome c-type biogenesis protein CcmH/NrfF
MAKSRLSNFIRQSILWMLPVFLVLLTVNLVYWDSKLDNSTKSRLSC